MNHTQLNRLDSLLNPYPEVHKLKHVANDNRYMTIDEHLDYLWSLVLGSKQ